MNQQTIFVPLIKVNCGRVERERDEMIFQLKIKWSLLQKIIFPNGQCHNKSGEHSISAEYMRTTTIERKKAIFMGCIVWGGVGYTKLPKIVTSFFRISNNTFSPMSYYMYIKTKPQFAYECLLLWKLVYLLPSRTLTICHCSFLFLFFSLSVVGSALYREYSIRHNYSAPYSL